MSPECIIPVGGTGCIHMRNQLVLKKTQEFDCAAGCFPTFQTRWCKVFISVDPQHAHYDCRRHQTFCFCKLLNPCDQACVPVAAVEYIHHIVPGVAFGFVTGWDKYLYEPLLIQYL